MTARRKPRRVIEAWASCGSHGKPFVSMINRRCPEMVGRFEVFETFEQAKAAGGYVHKVTLYVEREPATKWQ